ncbi:MAG TPA: hypothetical protein HPP56_00175 [Nitrospirae bacterium]|nr:hypothetical protein [Nitrospirota bacterium]
MPFAKVSQCFFYKVSYKIFHQLPKSAIELKSLVKSASKIGSTGLRGSGLEF